MLLNLNYVYMGNQDPVEYQELILHNIFFIQPIVLTGDLLKLPHNLSFYLWFYRYIFNLV